MSSATGCRGLVDVAVEIGAESVTIDVSSAGKDLGDLLARSEPSPSDRDELTDGHAAPRHNEALARIQATHDLAAVVAKFTLRDRPTHDEQRSTGATRLPSSRQRDSDGSAGIHDLRRVAERCDEDDSAGRREVAVDRRETDGYLVAVARHLISPMREGTVPVVERLAVVVVDRPRPVAGEHAERDDGVVDCSVVPPTSPARTARTRAGEQRQSIERCIDRTSPGPSKTLPVHQSYQRPAGK